MKTRFHLVLAAICLSAMSLTSCMSMGPGLSTGQSAAQTNTSSSSSSTLGNVLGSVLDGLIGNAVPVTEQSLVGTWVYQSPEVRFESENFLSQAGGEVAAASIEEKLATLYSTVGIVPGSSGFIFNEDKTCTIALGANGINGTYTLDTKTNTIHITSSTGLFKLTGKVYFGLNSLVILFDAKKILSVAQTVATLTGKGSSTLGTVAGALSSYKGLMLGMNLKK